MKHLILTIATLFITLSTNAMGFEQAREQALFLTDKMAYELNLTDDQYEAAYEINLDYLLGINCEADLFGIYWQNRNLDMSYILTDWQYRAYCDALYFYRPLYWGSGYWHFRIFARYPRRTFFYFSSRPAFYHSYHGGHSWHAHGGSWYRDRHFGAAHRPGGDGRGMKDRFHNGSRNHGVGGPGNHGDHRNADVNRRPDNRNMNRENRDVNRGSHDMNRENRGAIRENRGTIRENRGTIRESNGSSFQQRGSSTRSTVHQNNCAPVRGNSGPARSNSGSSYSGGASRSNGTSFSGGGSRSGGSFNGGGSHSGGSRGAGGRSGGRR